MAQRVAYPSFVIGHRGAAHVAPENTLAGLRVAARLGVKMVEVDATLTREGRVVLLHDDTLDRTTNGHGPIAGASLDQVRALDAGAWFGQAFAGEPVPTLEGAIALLVNLGVDLNLEIKPSPGREAETAHAVMTVAMACWPDSLAPPLVSSFALEALKVAHHVAPHWPRALLQQELSADWSVLAKTLDVSAVHLWHEPLSQSDVEALHAAGYAVAAYTVNDPAQAQKLRSWGVDAVFSDDPAGLLGILAHNGTAIEGR